MENNLSELIERQKANVRINECDYRKDGLLYCGKCDTPKEVMAEAFGKPIVIPCLCVCEAKKRDEREAELKRQKELGKILNLRKLGFSEDEMQNWTFDKDDGSNPKTIETAKRYVECFGEMYQDGKGLLLFGGTGTGKTFTAACIANALIDKGVPCLMTNFARLINTISGTYEKQDVLDKLNRYSLLVIDDLAAERDTEYMSETVYNIIDARYRSGKPLIVTTNLTAEELKNPLELRKQRIFSRLYEMCIPIHVEGPDRRKAKLRENVKKYSEMLKGE